MLEPITSTNMVINFSSTMHSSRKEDTRVEGPKRRPEGGEWEPIKIPHGILAYIPKLTQIHNTRNPATLKPGGNRKTATAPLHERNQTNSTTGGSRRRQRGEASRRSSNRDDSGDWTCPSGALRETLMGDEAEMN
jgi:hypothetical protein